MLRILVLSLALLLANAGAAAAQTCATYFRPGDLVAVNWSEARPVPAIVLIANEGCHYLVRRLARPGEPVDLDAYSLTELDVSDPIEPAPYDKPHGCPYGPDDAIDFRDPGKLTPWAPAKVLTSDIDCNLEIAYHPPAGGDVRVAVDRLSLGTSVRPSELQ